MPTLRKRVPKMRNHRGYAVVSLGGTKVHLGKWGSKVAHAEYDRRIAEWLLQGRKSPTEQARPTVGALIVAYLRQLKRERLNGGIYNQRSACRYLRLYADAIADEFGPLALQAIRERMIGDGHSRTHINELVKRIIAVFKWGASVEMVDGNVVVNLRQVAALRKGKTRARESVPIPPVADQVIASTIEHLPAVVADMVKLQRLLGCRPTEVCTIRPRDINRTGEVWTYVPESHKTQYLGKDRAICIGPKGQEILMPYLLRDEVAYCFSPVESERKRREMQHKQRTTPIGCGNRPGTNKKRKPRRSAKLFYTEDSYRNAVTRAAKKAFPLPEKWARQEGESADEWKARLEAVGERTPMEIWRKQHHWAPNQLRHSRATEIRKDQGLEAAQVTLGHSSAQITQVYAERDHRLAAEVAKRSG